MINLIKNVIQLTALIIISYNAETTVKLLGTHLHFIRNQKIVIQIVDHGSI